MAGLERARWGVLPVALAWGLLACGDIVVPQSDTSGDTTPDVVADATVDALPDLLPDGEADATPDGIADGTADVGPDSSGPDADVAELPEVDGADAADAADTADATPDAEVDTGPELLTCVESALDPAFGDSLATAFTTAESDDFSGTCAVGSGKDVAWQWTVPFTEWFTIDTLGSDFDTVLYLREGACDGPETACNNDADGDIDRSRIVGRFEAGTTYALVVDGNSGASGNAVLNIQPVTCPSADIDDGATLPQTFTTASGATSHGGACGGDTGPERSYRFIPPKSGLWRFSATADPTAGLNPAIYLEDGPVCGGTLLQCNGHDQGGIKMPADVSRVLTAGEPVTLIVDSRSGQGKFDLDAEFVSETCPAVALTEMLDDAVDITKQTDTMTSSCGQNADVEFEGFNPYPDLVFTVDDQPPGSPGACSLFIESGFNFSLAVMRGECTGAEIACRVDAKQDSASGNYKMSYSLPELGGKLTVSISPIVPQWGGWTSSNVKIGIGCVI
ncbi:MAG: hypothetical protein H6744_09380 [Deltaproteobacteria bacterium]|nr:hypothetical protein [Deltaproteobacteria bacterium]